MEDCVNKNCLGIHRKTVGHLSHDHREKVGAAYRSMDVDSVTVCELCLHVHRPWLQYGIYLDPSVWVPLLSLQ